MRAYKVKRHLTRFNLKLVETKKAGSFYMQNINFRISLKNRGGNSFFIDETVDFPYTSLQYHCKFYQENLFEFMKIMVVLYDIGV